MQHLPSGELACEPVPAGLGIFDIFEDDAPPQQFLANRYRRRSSAAPRKRISE